MPIDTEKAFRPLVLKRIHHFAWADAKHTKQTVNATQSLHYNMIACDVLTARERFRHAASKDFTRHAVQSIIPKDCIFDSGSTGQSAEAVTTVRKDCMTVINLPGHMPDRPNQVEAAVSNYGTL